MIEPGTSSPSECVDGHPLQVEEEFPLEWEHPSSESHVMRTSPDYANGGADRRADVVFIADGWTRNLVLEMLKAGDLEEMQEHFIDRGGLLSDVVSNLPSVSLSSHTSILTSSYQDEHHIAGHRWRDDAGRVTDYLRASGHRRVNGDISPNVRTVFEGDATGHAFSIQGVVERGATRKTHILTMSPEPILCRADSLIRTVTRSTSVVWLPRVDALSHMHGPDSPRIRAEMIRTSRALGRFAVGLERDGYLDDARLAIVSDHGHEHVHRRLRLEEPFARAGVDVVVNHRRNVAARALALTSGDRSAHVYLPHSDLAEVERIARTVVEDPGIELAAWRAQDGVWSFAGASGMSSASWVDPATIAYETLTGIDPLELCASGVANIDVREPLVNLGLYPDFLHQVMRSHVPGRSGNLLLFAGKGTHFGRGPRMGYRLGYHRGSHGGPFHDEVIVAAAYRSPEPIEDRPIRSADLLRTLGFAATHGRAVRHGVSL